jgi:DNA adenine methylase
MSDLLHQDYLPTQLVANILGRTIQHTRLLFRHGKIRAAKIGRDWLVARSDLAQYLAKCVSGLEYHPAQEQIGDGRRVANLADGTPRLFDEPAFTTTNGLLTSVNVAQVPQRSPFRYPGGKTWLIPHVRQWLRSLRPRATVLVEPFAGGGSVSLTAAFEDLTDYVIMVELDQDVAAVWKTLLETDVLRLVERIRGFRPSAAAVQQVLAQPAAGAEDQAFATIVRNRVARGGILAPGAGVVKQGESGRGLRSRWYPKTLCRRILEIAKRRDRIFFIEGDGLRVLRVWRERADCAFFIDPPYTVAGRRLYRHSAVDHEELFRMACELRGDFLMTYDDAAEIRALASRHGLSTGLIAMKTTHHWAKRELLIARDLSWLTG